MSRVLPPPKSSLVRHTNRLLELRDRHGFQWLMSWVLLEPAPVKPNTVARRRHWRKIR